MDELQVLGAEAELLEVQALTSAKLVDAAVAEGRSHQVAPAYRIMTEALNSLKALAAASKKQAAEGEDGGDASGIPRSLLDDPALGFLRSCNTGWLPLKPDGEREAVQYICTLPRGHSGPHEGKPEEGRVPQHHSVEYGAPDSKMSMEYQVAED